MDADLVKGIMDYSQNVQQMLIVLMEVQILKDTFRSFGKLYYETWKLYAELYKGRTEN